MSSAPVRLRRVGLAEVARAHSSGEPLRLVLHPAGRLSAAAGDLLETLRRDGVRIRRAGREEMTRLSGSRDDIEVLGLVGPPPEVDLEAVLGLRGAVWLLVGTAYPGNAGFVIRSAEVSGADGVVIDAPFDHSKRREARRASMRADRFFPVFFEKSENLLNHPAATARRLLAVEDRGRRSPWDEDLCAPSIFVIGGERSGVPEWILDRADAILRLPMLGFVASYNLQAAMAAVAAERLRQLEASGDPSGGA